MRNKCTAILLSGGTGSRMAQISSQPKQYLKLHDKEIILYSFQTLLDSPCIDEIIVVCDPAYKQLFSTPTSKPISFALPGTRRQDSVYNGMKAANPTCAYVLVHDGARPFMTPEIIERTIAAAEKIGAATAAMPLKFTIKVADKAGNVIDTLDRESLWEIQTPQVLRRDLLEEGFAIAYKNNKTVTDDVSLAELLEAPVKLVEGSYDNIKITVPNDLILANQILQNECLTITS